MEDDKETAELQSMMEVIHNEEEVIVDAIPLATKPPSIVDWKIIKEGNIGYYQIIRADGNLKRYSSMIQMLKSFYRRFGKSVKINNIWKNQQGLVKVLNWKLYDSCGVHCVTMQNILYYLLVEKMYPLTKHTLHQMFNDVKLQVDYECEMAFELLRLVKKQLKEGYGRIVGIKSLLEVTAVKLVLLVQKLLLLVLKVNAAGLQVTTAERLQLLKG
ncbi:hypothetical protein Tco_0017923 [Tanacetum coccineum]